jgi:uncharacterized protein (DUF2225 family)
MTRIGTIKLKCPCCRRRFETKCALSTNTVGTLSTDFRQKAVGLQPLQLAVHSCLSCGYSGCVSDFEKRLTKKYKAYPTYDSRETGFSHDSHTSWQCVHLLSNALFSRRSLKLLIRKNIRPLLQDGDVLPHRRYEYAGWIAGWRGDSSAKIGDLYLRAAWCCHDSGRGEEERSYRLKAIEHFEKAFHGNEIGRDDEAFHTYLIGENYRRVGMQERASSWYARAIEAAGDDAERQWLVRLARQQKTKPKDFIRE